MNELFRDSLYAGVTLSLAAYMLGVLLKKRFRLGIFNPLLISIADPSQRESLEAAARAL